MEVITKCIAAAICTKNSNWDEQAYQKGVVEPYRKIKNLKEEILKENRQPSIEEVGQALDMLKSVLLTKMVSKEKQIEYIGQILGETKFKEIFKNLEVG